MAPRVALAPLPRQPQLCNPRTPMGSRDWSGLNAFGQDYCDPALFQLIDERPDCRPGFIAIDEAFLRALRGHIRDLRSINLCRFLCDMQGHWDRAALPQFCVGEISRADLVRFCRDGIAARVRPE